MLASVLRAGSKCVCEPALLARLILSSQGASMTSKMKHGPPVRITCSGRASSPVIWSAAVGFVLVPDMRSAWTLSWASLGMYGACEHESFCCVRACCMYSAGCRRMWVLIGANAVTGSSGVPLMKVFAMDLVKIALFVDFLVSNLFTVFE